MFIGEHEQIHQVRLYKTSNGGSLGDAWGEFITQPDDFKSVKYFTSGEWMYFSRNYSKTKADFIKGKFIY